VPPLAELLHRPQDTRRTIFHPRPTCCAPHLRMCRGGPHPTPRSPRRRSSYRRMLLHRRARSERRGKSRHRARKDSRGEERHRRRRPHERNRQWGRRDLGGARRSLRCRRHREPSSFYALAKSNRSLLPSVSKARNLGSESVCSVGTLTTGKGPGRIVILRGLCEVSVDLERLCYPFFDLVIEVERVGRPVWLRIRAGKSPRG
jgi:hypothetical protein